MSEGSSPLARGLRDRVRFGSARARIIPARAGFTWRRWAFYLPRQDHPRSRGVYGSISAVDPVAVGSSPLARGLQMIAQVLRPLVRIIPARAGFTSRPCPARTRKPDHPRSRGVYGLLCGVGHAPKGSSPLARGLHMRLEKGIVADRIIPARAGFTSSCPSGVWTVRDHPRSRGVYQQIVSDEAAKKGSSPLARGLLGRVRRRILLRWIIPARAGFTRVASGVFQSV